MRILLGIITTNHTYPFSLIVNIFIWSHSIDHWVCTDHIFILNMVTSIVISVAVAWIVTFYSVWRILCWCDVGSLIFTRSWQVVIYTSGIFNFVMISCGISFLNSRCFRRFVMLRLYSINIFLMFSESISAILEVIVFQWWTRAILLLSVLVSHWTRLFFLSTILNLRHRFWLLEHFLVHLILFRIIIL